PLRAGEGNVYLGRPQGRHLPSARGTPAGHRQAQRGADAAPRPGTQAGAREGARGPCGHRRARLLPAAAAGQAGDAFHAGRMSMSTAPFWERLSLREMNREQWESLCDGCGKCCLIKLEDEDSGCIQYTAVVCRYLDQKRCSCKVYSRRRKLVPTCVELHPDELDSLYWMPSTCAYRLLHE